MNKKCKIGEDLWEIVYYLGPDGSEGYVIVKNGQEFESILGDSFEVFSDACFAILNEYSVE